MGIKKRISVRSLLARLGRRCEMKVGHWWSSPKSPIRMNDNIDVSYLNIKFNFVALKVDITWYDREKFTKASFKDVAFLPPLSHLPLNSSTDEVDLTRRKHQRLWYFLPLYINIALAILCSERLSGGRKMNTRSNPEMTELAMMTNVPAGRTAGSAIAHCYQDGLSHMTQQEVYPRHCFRVLFF